MYFRRLYWVTEKLNNNGKSDVVGVYTSIPDLLDDGLCWFTNNKVRDIRITLIKLDSSKDPLGCWTSPSFDKMEEHLAPYIQTQDFTEEECLELIGVLRAFSISSTV